MASKANSDRKQRPAARVRRWQRAVGMVSALGAACAAHAVEIEAGSDWQLKWDNTLTYSLGLRARDADQRISRSLNFDETDNKFSRAGDVVTNRIALLSEFDAVYKDHFGLRISGSAWKDFAYDGRVASASGDFVPGVPYAALTSYEGSRYSAYTRKYYQRGAQLLDAFVFGRADLANIPVAVKLGRQTQYWGNSLFQGAHSISYAQSALDQGKALATPGAQLKELFLPRNQLSVQAQLTPELTLSGQYFLEWSPNRLPEGGTYLGFVDFLFQGPNRAFLGQFNPVTGAPVLVPHGQDVIPNDRNRNFGVNMRWSPEALHGSLGVYYRRFDDTQPWAPLLGRDPATRAVNYHAAYGQGTELIGVSLDKQIGDFSTGFELSYRRNMALNSMTGPLPTDLRGSEGARGNTLHAVANIVAGLTPTALYDTGVAIAELGWGRKLSVTGNAPLYAGAGGACGAKWRGCSTDNVVNLSLQFTPQWLQALPGVDLSLPLSDTIGLHGNGPTPSSGYQGSHIYSVGLGADIHRKYKLKLAYNGYRYRPGTPAPYYAGGTSVYQSGNGYYWLNDRSWLSLSLQGTF